MRRITSIAIMLTDVLGCSYAGSAAAVTVTPVEVCQELAEMGGVIMEYRPSPH